MRMGFSFYTTLLLGALSLAGCSGTQKNADSPDNYSFSPAEASEYLRELRGDQGAQGEGPKTIEEVFVILRKDELSRFDGAARLVENMKGVEALSIRAIVHLMRADIYLTVADLLKDMGSRARAERERLVVKEEHGSTLTEEEEQRVEELSQKGRSWAKTDAALRVLQETERAAGGSLAQEAVQLYPKEPSGYRAAAYFYYLDNNWLRFDDMMKPLEEVEGKDAGLSYLRAMESLYREANRKRARASLEEALAANPQLVRAQAKLVLVHDDIARRHEELVQLKTLNPTHPIVALVGPEIIAEYEATRAIEEARSSD